MYNEAHGKSTMNYNKNKIRKSTFCGNVRPLPWEEVWLNIEDPGLELLQYFLRRLDCLRDSIQLFDQYILSAVF
jgi:hypothetical protein